MTPNFMILVNGGLSGSAQPGTRLPVVPQPVSRIYMVNVSMCTQADLDRRYTKKLGQLRWLQAYAQSSFIPDIRVCVVPIPVAMTSKVHRNFFPDTDALRLDQERAWHQSAAMR